MKSWLNKALQLLGETLNPPKAELNELDWKAALSPDKKRLAEHLSAFANYPGGGFMVFGIDNAGNPTGVHSKTVETTLNQLSNLARAALEPTLSLASGADCTPCERTKTVFYRHPPISPVARTTL